MTSKNTFLPSTFSINCRGRLLSFTEPQVMGILNINDDSFYGGSRVPTIDLVLQRAAQMLAEGAAILDIGGQSTRPQALQVGVAAELERVIPAVMALHEAFPQAILSIDTFYSQVAREAVQAGACIVNDISAGEMDTTMLATVAELQVPYIAMHMQGNPATMQKDPQYGEVTCEVMDFFIHKVHACRMAGIRDVIVDPGFGFGKTLLHNQQLLKNLSVFRILQCPLLVGISRKSMVYRLLHTVPEEALNGTTVLHTLALLQGIQLLRVHDVKAAKEAITLCQYYTAT